MKTYKLEDIFGFAADVEERGKQFYENASAQADAKDAKGLFAYLSKAETKHAKKFLKFHKAYSRKGTSFRGDSRLEAMFDTLMRGMLFPRLEEVKEAIGKADRNPLVSLLRLAMGVETNSILFYQEMSSVLDETETKDAVSKIVKEEQGHLIKLRGLRMEIDPYYSALKFGSWF